MQSTDEIPMLFDLGPIVAPARGRPRKLGAVEEVALVEARDDGTPWKVLCQRYDMSRSKLAEAYERGKARILGVISGHNS